MFIALIVTLSVVGAVAIAGVIVGFVLRVLRKTDPKRAVASTSAAPGVPFTLRFTTSAPGPHGVWLRFDIDYPGNRLNFGLTAQAEVKVGDGPVSPVEVRLGYLAPALGPNGVQKFTLYRSSRYRALGRAALRATVDLASLPAAPPGSAVQIDGTVVAAETSTAKNLLVFVVPA